MIELINRGFPVGTSRRAVTFVIGPLIISVAFLRFALPGGTPLGVLLLGAVAGARAALLAVGIVLVYRSLRVVNFAQGALAAVTTNLTFDLIIFTHLPFALAALIGMIVAVVSGAIVELIFIRRFFRSPWLVLTVITIVLASVLPSAGVYIDKLPLWGHGPDVQKIQSVKRYPGPFTSWHFAVKPLAFGFPAVATLVVVTVALVSLTLFMRYSKLGTAIRGTAENSDRALLLGINVGFLSTVVWAIAGALAGAATILHGMAANWTSVGAPDLLMPALAAAVIARMKSFPTAVVAAIGLAMGEAAFNWSFPKSSKWAVVILVVLCAGLLVQRGRYSRVDEGLTSSWKATEEVRPTPRELLAVPGVRRLRRGLYVVAAILLLVYPQAFSPGTVNLASLVGVYALIGLSLVVLTGWGGQISLGQVGFVAIGEIVAANLAVKLHTPMVVSLPVTIAITAGVAALVGLPALRLRGPFLAVTTFAFAFVVAKVVLNPNEFPSLQVAEGLVHRPTFLFVSFAGERSFYYLSLGITGVAALVVRRLRAGRPGRVLIALREDDQGVQTFGINVVRTRISVFMLSGALTGAAGWLWVFHDTKIGDPTKAEFLAPAASIAVFIMAMTGGISSVSGALLGALYLGFTQLLIPDDQLRTLSQGLPLLLLLFASPGGLAALLYSLRDSLLRIVALRRRMLVPSLFADVDPEIVLAQKTPLADISDGRGLDALPPDQRYEIESELYPRPRNLASVIPGGDR